LYYGRGRPGGQRQPIAEMSRLLYLIRVSKKYDLETDKFLACFLDAWTHGKSSYKGISIHCRLKAQTNGVFLVTQGQKVIAQLSLSEVTLKHLPEVDLKRYPWNKPLSVSKAQKLRPVDMQIKDVDASVKWVNLKGKIVGKSTTRTVFSKFGNPLGVSTATISDKTGSIKLPLWNTQINMVSIGDTVQIENGRVRQYRGELQVSVGKSGKLIVIRNP